MTNNTIESVIEKLEKANLLLANWTQEYGYSETPNPALIFNKNESIQKEQAFAWNCEYKNIVGTVAIIGDYIAQAKSDLELCQS